MLQGLLPRGSFLAWQRACYRTPPCTPTSPRKTFRARKFYEEKLGFTHEFGKGTAGFLYPTPNAGTSRASQAFWQVDDIEREVAELKKRGVKFEDYDLPGMEAKDGIFTGGGARAAWFKDSEGNILAVIQTL